MTPKRIKYKGQEYKLLENQDISLNEEQSKSTKQASRDLKVKIATIMNKPQNAEMLNVFISDCNKHGWQSSVVNSLAHHVKTEYTDLPYRQRGGAITNIRGKITNCDTVVFLPYPNATDPGLHNATDAVHKMLEHWKYCHAYYESLGIDGDKDVGYSITVDDVNDTFAYEILTIDEIAKRMQEVVNN